MSPFSECQLSTPHTAVQHHVGQTVEQCYLISILEQLLSMSADTLLNGAWRDTDAGSGKV